MNILITGGAGYLGTTLVPLLLDAGHRVTVLDTLRFGIGPILPWFRHPQFHFARVDVRDRAAVEEQARSADAFVHLAAIVGYPACVRQPELARSTNLDGVRNIAAVAGRGRPVVFASTSSCYGEVAEGVCTEDTPLRPVSLYGTTKAEGEAILFEACDAVVYRIATAYGLSPRLRLDLMINDFVHRAVHTGRLAIYEGHFRRSFIHVGDVARAFLLGVEKASQMSGRVFNVGDKNQNYTKLDLCRQIEHVIPGVTVDLDTSGKDLDRRNYDVDYSRIAALGFHATIPLETGLRELAAALRWIDRPERFSNIEETPSGV